MLCFSDVAFLGKYLSHNRIQRTCHPDELSCCRCIYTMWPVLENTEDIFVSKQMRPLLIKYNERGGIKEGKPGYIVLSACLILSISAYKIWQAIAVCNKN